MLRKISLSFSLALIALLATLVLVAPAAGARIIDRAGGSAPAIPTAPQTILFADDFSYGAVPMSLTVASAGNWVNHSGTGSVLYITSSLSMTGYGSSGVGGAAAVTTAGAEDVNRSFTNQVSGTVYFAALVNVSTATSTGDYFLHFKDATTGFRARVFAQLSAGNLRFGLGTTGAATYATDVFTYNTTYLVTAKYNVDTGDTALYVLDTFTSTEPITPQVFLAGAGTPFAVQAVAIRQGATGQRPAAIIDGVRVANTWAEAVGYVPPPEAALDITKPGPDTALAGEMITYTIGLFNTGNFTAASTLVTDSLPAEVTFVTYTTALPNTFSQAGSDLIWDLGDVANGASGTIKVQVAISPALSNGTLFTNTVTASTTTTETVLSNNTAQAKTLIGAPDLVVVKDGPTMVNAGDDVVYTLTYSNAGTLNAINVQVADTLPAAMAYVTDSLGTGNVTGQNITWMLGTLNAGASGSIVLTTTGNYAGDWPNTATISGGPADNDPNNNSSTITTTINGANAYIIKQGPTALFGGEVAVYTITYGNKGNQLTDVFITDTLPVSFTPADIVTDTSGLSFVDGANTRRWAATLNGSSELSFTLLVSVPTDIANNTRVTNTVDIAQIVAGNDPADDISTAASTVYQIVPVATMRAGSIGQVFVITGTVTVEPGVYTYNGQNRYMYIQDETGGVLVYRGGGLNPVTRGNVVRIIGSRDEYRAETEFIPAEATDVVDLGAGTLVTPLLRPTGSIDESVEGQLVQISGQITGKPASYRLQVNDGSGMVEVNRYFNLGQITDTNYIDFAPFAVGDYVRVAGVTRGYTESFGFAREVLPRGPIDIAKYPRVLSVSPASATIDVAVTTQITAAFNLTMTNLSDATFLLQDASGSVAGTVSYDAATRAATFAPAASLAFNTLYTATLKSTLVADNGLTLMPDQDYVWTFTTVPATPDLSASTLINSVNNAVHAGQWVTYTITLNNAGAGDATTVITDDLDFYYSVAHALDFTQPTAGTLTWTGVVTAGQSVTLQFVAEVKAPQYLPLGTTILFNSARVNDGYHTPFTIEDPAPPFITIHGLYLPLIKR